MHNLTIIQMIKLYFEGIYCDLHVFLFETYNDCKILRLKDLKNVLLFNDQLEKVLKKHTFYKALNKENKILYTINYPRFYFTEGN